MKPDSDISEFWRENFRAFVWDVNVELIVNVNIFIFVENQFTVDKKF
jgi:hypothetical protein